MPKRYRTGPILLIALLLLAASCEHPRVKPTEDSRRLDQIEAYLESLKQSFQDRNLASFSDLYVKDRPDDLGVIGRSLESIRTLQLDFAIDRIVLDGEQVQVFLHWELRWQAPNGGPAMQRGNTLFHLSGRSELVLWSIEGDNPFITPSLKKAPRS